MDYLLAAGGKVNAQTDQGYTPLHSVALWGDIANAKWLLAHRANPRLKNKKGQTPLQLAEWFQHETKTDRKALIAYLKKIS